MVVQDIMIQLDIIYSVEENEQIIDYYKLSCYIKSFDTNKQTYVDYYVSIPKHNKTFFKKFCFLKSFELIY
jgi:hypothetical protein